MAVLVTGAGMIGAYFAQIALRRGEKVVFIDPVPRSDYLDERLGAGRYTLVQEDVRNLPALLDVIRAHDVDAIVHTAARIGGRVSSQLHEAFGLNILGTQSVAEAVRLAGVRRLVHISTFGVYDWRRPTPEPIVEDFPRGSGAPYGNFKVAQEMILEAYQSVHKFELAMIRTCNVFGVGHFWAGSGGGEKVQELVTAGLERRLARIPRTQTMAYEYIYARDLGRAVDLAVVKSLSGAEIFNIGSGVTTGFDALTSAVRKALPDLEVTIVPGAPPTSREQHLDLTRAREQLGWTPGGSLEDAITEYVDEMRVALGLA